jgi:hypothetical protein
VPSRSQQEDCHQVLLTEIIKGIQLTCQETGFKEGGTGKLTVIAIHSNYVTEIFDAQSNDELQLV